MKRFVVILTLLVSPLAHADFFDSNWFEPSVMCVGVGATGYLLAPKSDQAAYAAIGCVAGAGITYLINKHYESKYSKAYQKQLDQAMEAVRQFEELQANKAANGDEGPYSLRVRQIVPGQKLPNGEVSSPQIREMLIVPGSDLKVGE